MSKFSQIMRMIKNELAIRGATPEDLFDDADKFKSGYITYDAFNRALNYYNIRIRNQDFQELIINLADNGRISCTKFLSKMKEISKENQAKSEISFRSTTNHSNSEAALIQLQGFLSVHQLSLRDVLRPFDRLNRGLVSVNDFIRAFSSASTVQAKLIANDFKDRFSDNVRYKEIEKALLQIESNNSNNFSNSARMKPRSPIIDQVISEIIEKNITDLRQFFELHDYVNNGYVSKRVFPSIIEKAANIRLNINEISEFYDFYGVQEHVRYLPLVQEVEQGIKDKEIDKNHHYSNENGKLIDTDFLLQEMKELFYGRRVNVPTLFPYAVNGQCSRYKFLKTLSVAQKQLSVDELNAIANRFDIGNSVIDVDSFLSHFGVNGKTRNSNLQDSNIINKEQINVDEVLSDIRQHLISRNLCLRRQCELFDRLKTGQITNAQLLASIQKCGYQINDSEFDAIISRFELDRGDIDYIQICNIVDNPDIYNQQIRQIQKQQQINQRRSPKRHIYSDKETTDYNKIRKLNQSSELFDPENPKPSQMMTRELRPPPLPTLRIVAKIADITRNREVYLRDEFAERDRAKHGTVNQDDFMRVITLTSSNAKLTTNEIAEVFVYYSQKSDFFDYRSFCRDIERCNREAHQSTNPGRYQTPQAQQQQAQYENDNETDFDNEYSTLNDDIFESPQLLQAIRKYKAFLASKMLQTDDVFRRYDQNGTGYIKSMYLSSALVSAGIEMSPKETQLLFDKYSDKIIEGRFLYRKLGLRADQEKINASDIRMLLNPEFAEEEERRILFGSLSEIREKLHVRRRNAFMIFGALPSNTITPKEFNNMLLDVGIILVPKQLDALTKKYTHGDMINFDCHLFCNDCENCSLIGNRDSF